MELTSEMPRIVEIHGPTYQVLLPDGKLLMAEATGTPNDTTFPDVPEVHSSWPEVTGEYIDKQSVGYSYNDCRQSESCSKALPPSGHSCGPA
ncbi:hypothetical protein pipiens_015249 [Culex pipiens pipiens]|uniref:Uncharacterized protein n=1 Tax=Culex pipiens pipiens TaxID=38569 RepID=A0ABD1CRC1_CULPP